MPGTVLRHRFARARFIGDILADLDFEVAVTGDVVAARRSGLGASDVEQALRVVGYLLVHIRQLDMIMADSTAVAHYGAKMRADLAQFR